MISKSFKGQTGKYLKANPTKIVFILLLLFFLINGLFIALNLVSGTGIIPDEERTFVLSKQFSTTLGVPKDAPENLKLNQVNEQNPNLYYWINGRIINIVKLMIPIVDDLGLLKILRVFNVFYALGTVIFCYLLSKEMIDHKWWQLIPVFMLVCTNAFVFLAGGVNDDNLTHLACSAAIYFLVRILNKRDFLTNSLAMFISLAASALIKHRVLPLIFAVILVWTIYFIKHRKSILPLKVVETKTFILASVLVCLIIGNFAIYGYNLAIFHSVLPSCHDVLTAEQCNLRRFYFEDLGPEYQLAWKNNLVPLTLSESLELGYPGPIRYFFMNWIPYMLTRTFAVFGTNVPISFLTIITHHILLYTMILITIFYWRDYSLKIIGLLGILIFYTVILFIYCYRYEMQISFNYEIIQGRYLFSVINIAFVFAVLVIKRIPPKIIRSLILIIFIVLYFLTGPMTFIQLYISPFSKIIFN